eukprot:Rmarinus@m.19534
MTTFRERVSLCNAEYGRPRGRWYYHPHNPSADTGRHALDESWWVPFHPKESLRLERGYLRRRRYEVYDVKVREGRYTVSLADMTLSPVYWSGHKEPVLRATWFVTSSSNSSRVVPYDLETASLLEKHYVNSFCPPHAGAEVRPLKLAGTSMRIGTCILQMKTPYIMFEVAALGLGRRRRVFRGYLSSLLRWIPPGPLGAMTLGSKNLAAIAHDSVHAEGQGCSDGDDGDLDLTWLARLPDDPPPCPRYGRMGRMNNPSQPHGREVSSLRYPVTVSETPLTSPTDEDGPACEVEEYWDYKSKGWLWNSLRPIRMQSIAVRTRALFYEESYAVTDSHISEMGCHDARKSPQTTRLTFGPTCPRISTCGSRLSLPDWMPAPMLALPSPETLSPPPAVVFDDNLPPPSESHRPHMPSPSTASSGVSSPRLPLSLDDACCEESRRQSSPTPLSVSDHASVAMVDATSDPSAKSKKVSSVSSPIAPLVRLKKPPSSPQAARTSPLSPTSLCIVVSPSEQTANCSIPCQSSTVTSIRLELSSHPSKVGEAGSISSAGELRGPVASSPESIVLPDVTPSSQISLRSPAPVHSSANIDSPESTSATSISVDSHTSLSTALLIEGNNDSLHMSNGQETCPDVKVHADYAVTLRTNRKCTDSNSTESGCRTLMSADMALTSEELKEPCTPESNGSPSCTSALASKRAEIHDLPCNVELGVVSSHSIGAQPAADSMSSMESHVASFSPSKFSANAEVSPVGETLPSDLQVDLPCAGECIVKADVTEIPVICQSPIVENHFTRPLNVGPHRACILNEDAPPLLLSVSEDARSKECRIRSLSDDFIADRSSYCDAYCRPDRRRTVSLPNLQCLSRECELADSVVTSPNTPQSTLITPDKGFTAKSERSDAEDRVGQFGVAFPIGECGEDAVRVSASSQAAIRGKIDSAEASPVTTKQTTVATVAAAAATAAAGAATMFSTSSPFTSSLWARFTPFLASPSAASPDRYPVLSPHKTQSEHRPTPLKRLPYMAHGEATPSTIPWEKGAVYTDPIAYSQGGSSVGSEYAYRTTSIGATAFDRDPSDLEFSAAASDLELCEFIRRFSKFTDVDEDDIEWFKLIRREQKEDGLVDDEGVYDDPQFDHLVLLVHGIGNGGMSENEGRLHSVVEDAERYRLVGRQVLRDYLGHLPARNIEVLPIEWHTDLHRKHEVDTAVDLITLEGVPWLRHFVNDTVLDVLYFMSPRYHQVIVSEVSNKLNSVYEKFLQNNPYFGGGVSLIGHSLGSIILFDILSHQPPVWECMKVSPQEHNMDHSTCRSRKEQIPRDDLTSNSGHRCACGSGSHQDDRNRSRGQAPACVRRHNEHFECNDTPRRTKDNGPYSAVSRCDRCGDRAPSRVTANERQSWGGDDLLRCSKAQAPAFGNGYSTSMMKNPDTLASTQQWVDAQADVGDRWRPAGRACSAASNGPSYRDHVGRIHGESPYRNRKGPNEDDLWRDHAQSEIETNWGDLMYGSEDLRGGGGGGRGAGRDGTGGTAHDSSYPASDALAPMSTVYPVLTFAPQRFFAMGSPIGLFVTIRGKNLGRQFRLPTCPRLFNLFYPYDPVAYRIEPLIAKELSSVPPVVVRHHKRGGRRLHYKCQEISATFHRVVSAVACGCAWAFWWSLDTAVSVHYLWQRRKKKRRNFRMHPLQLGSGQCSTPMPYEPLSLEEPRPELLLEWEHERAGGLVNYRSPRSQGDQGSAELSRFSSRGPPLKRSEGTGPGRGATWGPGGTAVRDERGKWQLARKVSQVSYAVREREGHQRYDPSTHSYHVMDSAPNHNLPRPSSRHSGHGAAQGESPRISAPNGIMDTLGKNQRGVQRDEAPKFQGVGTVGHEGDGNATSPCGKKDARREADPSVVRNASWRFGALNGGHRIDYVLQERPLHAVASYLTVVSSHSVYWTSKDTMLFIFEKILKAE